MMVDYASSNECSGTKGIAEPVLGLLYSPFNAQEVFLSSTKVTERDSLKTNPTGHMKNGVNFTLEMISLTGW